MEKDKNKNEKKDETIEKVSGGKVSLFSPKINVHIVKYGGPGIMLRYGGPGCIKPSSKPQKIDIQNPVSDSCSTDCKTSGAEILGGAAKEDK